MNLNKIKKILMILRFLIPFVLVIAYCFNLYFALILQGPYWQMWVIITTAAIGASLPVWLVWYLTEKSKEEKDKKRLKNDIMYEYSVALNNLTKTCATLGGIEKSLSQQGISRLFVPNYREHDFKILAFISNFIQEKEKKSLINGVISLVLLIETLKQGLEFARPQIENNLSNKLYYTEETFSENAKQMINCIAVLKDIINSQGRILCCIANYIYEKYQIDCYDELKELDPYKKFEEINSEKNKANNTNSTPQKEQEQNVSTERLSK